MNDILNGLLKLFSAALVVLFIVYGSTFDNTVSKRTGDAILIFWDPYPDNSQLGGYSIYRSNGVSGNPQKVAALPSSATQWQTTMPGGTTAQYRFLVRPVSLSGNEIGPAGKELIVNRIK